MNEIDCRMEWTSVAFNRIKDPKKVNETRVQSSGVCPARLAEHDVGRRSTEWPLLTYTHTHTVSWRSSSNCRRLLVAGDVTPNVYI